MKVDLHNHTWYSADGTLPPKKLVELAKRRGMDAIAITDHNRLTKLKTKDEDMMVIQGEEVKTTQGELLALFIEEEIPPNLPPLETIDLIKEQGGIYIVAHPFDEYRRSTALLLNGFEPPKDAIIEVLNARYVSVDFYKKALEFAQGRFPITGSSDAHTSIEVGKAWTELPPFSDEEELKKLLLKGEGKPQGSLSPFWVHLTVPFIKMAHAMGILPGEEDGV